MNQNHIVQKLLINDGEMLPDELFYRGQYHLAGDHLVVPEKEAVSFDTYFNAFPAEQWNLLTDIQTVRFRFSLIGEGTLELWKTERGSSHLFAKFPFAYTEEKVLETESFRLQTIGDYVFFKITAAQSQVEIISGEILSDTPAKNSVHIACCFCTFKREREIRRNVQNLLEGIRKQNSILDNQVDIYIADNGHTLSPSDLDQSDHVFLYDNKNYGGSSGFTRCLIEACIRKPGEYSHIILMDDDAVIKDYVLERTAMLLSFLKPEYRDHMIGGALLSVQKPWLQAENGAVYTNRGIVLNGDKTDLRDFSNVILNQEPVADINYNAWFYACMPSAFIDEHNLPLPLFIHGDDIEYGLRFNHKILRMNGICIWHPDPAASRRPYLSYYDRRNYSIIEAINDPSMNAGKYRYTEWKKMLGLLAQYRYEDAWYGIWGIRDFLKGIDAFKELDPEQLNQTVLRWKKQPVCQISDGEFKKILRPQMWHKPSRVKRLANLVLPAVIKRKIYDTSVSWEAIGFFSTKEICIVDPETGSGIVLRKNPTEGKAIMKEFHKLEKEIFENYDRVALEWRDRIGELRSYSFWKDYLDI